MIMFIGPMQNMASALGGLKAVRSDHILLRIFPWLHLALFFCV